MAQANQSLPLVTCSYSDQPPKALLENDNILAVVDFGSRSTPTGQSRHFNTGLPLLGEPLCEVWQSRSKVEHGIDNDCYWSANDDLIFLGLWINENSFPDLQTAVFESYSTLLQTLQERDYPHLVRAWNYLPQINQGKGDNERYKQFCLGRHEAFSRYQRDHYPAATAIGHQGGDTVIYLIASRKILAQHYENPRQLSAFKYPREYGPKSPSFARASLFDGKQLYISGTASIHGHESLHLGDFSGQADVTCENIDTLVQHIANQCQLTTRPSLDMIKVYIRDPFDLKRAEAAVEKHFGPDMPIVYLHGDVCREELLIEIDGMCQI